MKRIFIIRHAKSDRGLQYQRDMDRPLNARGRSDARKMAAILKKDIDFLDRMLVSSAKRTTETAQFFIDDFDMDPDLVTYTEQLYLPVVTDIWGELSRVEEEAKQVAVFTHNPAAALLLNQYRPYAKLPTCSILEFRFDGTDWSGLQPGKVHFISHKYPRMYD